MDILKIRKNVRIIETSDLIPVIKRFYGEETSDGDCYPNITGSSACADE